MTAYKKKLIEVALPLEAINRESAREKSIRHGHPSTLHLWWARRPLATCRAVLFASVVDDPSAHPDEFPTEEDQEVERQRLFRIIEELVKWDNSTDERVMAAARAEIMRSTNGNPPPILDPFCGGGSIPLEAQRLGLEAHASDLNPVAVLITKALVEIPPKYAGIPPVNPEAQARLGLAGWGRAQGLAEDVRYYGKWVRDEAETRIGHLYPKVTLPPEHGGGEATVIAWLWARSARCPNPACGAEMPLVRSFALSTKKGNRIWVEPIVDAVERTVRFEVRTAGGVEPEGTKQRGRSRCLFCGTANITDAQLREQATNHGVGTQLMAIVAEGLRGRVFVSPEALHESVRVDPPETPWLEQRLPDNARWFSPPGYGLTTYSQLFTNRQLIALTAFSDLVADARQRAMHDAEAAWSTRGDAAISTATASDYADAIATYLGLACSRTANTVCTLAVWSQSRDQSVNAFSRQALPMTWDYPEVNPFAGAAGDFGETTHSMSRCIGALPASTAAEVEQRDAVASTPGEAGSYLVATDPPYYDNIGYADLSDFFYVWLRHALGKVYPNLLSTLLTPKAQELVATPYRFGGSRRKAQDFFEHGLGAAFEKAQTASSSEYPMTVYYAFKQAESDTGSTSDSGRTASTGWETMLAGLLRQGWSIVGTWPMRTERPTGVKVAVNALATSVVLVCRRRSETAALATRKEFIGALRAEMPDALRALQHGNIAPVDLAQASIGPGMAVFSRYSKVLEADGTDMSVRTALALINQALDEIVAEQEGDFDADTRWAIGWFEETGVQAGAFGLAETLCKAKNCSVQGLVEAGILEAKAGKVRLLRRDELDQNWDPSTDKRLTVWEMTQHLLRRLDDGEAAAAVLARQLGSFSEVARDLAYRLYLICERRKWAQEAFAYNALVVAWPQIQRLAAAEPASAGPSQTSFEV